jgi:hypothetical protein
MIFLTTSTERIRTRGVKLLNVCGGQSDVQPIQAVDANLYNVNIGECLFMPFRRNVVIKKTGQLL